MKKTKIILTILTLIALAALILMSISTFAFSKVKDNYEGLENIYYELKDKVSEISSGLSQINENILSNKNNEQNKNDSQADMQTDIYTVCEYDGVIGVFDANGNILRRINISVASLSLHDREMLDAGIVVYGNDELKKLLQDLG